MLQLFAIILLPLTILLVAITFGSISIHQQAMRSMVGDRDARAVRTAAGALNAQIDNRLKEVQIIAEMLSANDSQPITVTLNSLSALMPDFDAGVAMFNQQGQLLTKGEYQPMWHAWTADPRWQYLFAKLSSETGKLVLTYTPKDYKRLGLISSKLSDGTLVVGGFSTVTLIRSTLGDILPPDRQLSIWLVGADGRNDYGAGGFSDQYPDHPGVAEALRGEERHRLRERRWR